MHKIIYTNRIIPQRFAAITLGFIVLIRPQYSTDEGLRQHELKHVSQFWHNPLMPLLYLYSKKFRQKYEVEAYREQVAYSPHYKTLYALFLSTKYDLDLTQEEALKLLD